MDNKHILIVKLSAIGDVIHALPVAHALKQQFPKSKITWVVEKPAFDLLTNNPDIDEVIVFDKPKFKSFAGIIENGRVLSNQLKKLNINIAIDLQGLFKSAAISWLSGSMQRLVYCNAREGSSLIGTKICGPNANGHVVERYLDVARYLGCQITVPVFNIHISEQEKKISCQIAEKAGLFPESNRYMVLAPGTNWSSKCWPTKHFAALCDMLVNEDIIPVIIGGPGDQRLATEITANTAIPPVDLTGKTSLKQLSYIIKQAQAFIGGDTGPMHLAAAVGTKVITMFGPTDPKRNGPYGEGHVVLTVPNACAGCWQRSCEKGCMENISPDIVMSAISQYVLERKP